MAQNRISEGGIVVKKIADLKPKSIKIPSKIKQSHYSKTKAKLTSDLTTFCLLARLTLFTEYQFAKVSDKTKSRKYRFDWYIKELNLGIEYEGINGARGNKSRHTTPGGYTKDCEKYNLANKKGYMLLRYTAMSINKCLTDIKEIIENKNMKIAYR